MKNILISDLEKALLKSWCKETSSEPHKWTPQNPAWGQSAVTAALLDDYHHGELLTTKAILPDGSEITHHYNMIRKHYVDLTARQFPKGTIIPPGVPQYSDDSLHFDFPSAWLYLLSHEPTRERYKILKEKVAEELRKG